jgi:hypothetical protein
LLTATYKSKKKGSRVVTLLTAFLYHAHKIHVCPASHTLAKPALGHNWILWFGTAQMAGNAGRRVLLGCVVRVTVTQRWCFKINVGLRGLLRRNELDIRAGITISAGVLLRLTNKQKNFMST